MTIAALTGSVGRLPGIARSGAAETSAPAVPETPREPFLSPVFRFDKQARVLVFQFRDSETGNVTRQYPSEKVVKLYRDNVPKDVAPAAVAEPRRGSEAPAPTTTTTASSESTESSGASESASADTGSTEGTDRVRVTA